SAYPVAERVRVLSGMCDRWNVRAGRLGRNVPVDEHVAQAVERLAVRLSQVLQQSVGGHDSRLGWSLGTQDRRAVGWGASMSPETMSLLASVASPPRRGDHLEPLAASTASFGGSLTVVARPPPHLKFLRR
ncbi:uncharacterized protein Tco025E_08444, partial [Trypanosoma conorhini]